MTATIGRLLQLSALVLLPIALSYGLFSVRRVDRAKLQPAALISGKDVQKIATFIYYRGDREVGRIVERPSGLFEDDLLAIVAKD